MVYVHVSMYMSVSLCLCIQLIHGSGVCLIWDLEPRICSGDSKNESGGFVPAFCGFRDSGLMGVEAEVVYHVVTGLTCGGWQQLGAFVEKGVSGYFQKASMC